MDISDTRSKWNRIAEDVKGHKLRRDEDGDIDDFALEWEHHNGPACTVCEERWCHHCTRAEDIELCDGGAAVREAEQKAFRDRATRCTEIADQVVPEYRDGQIANGLCSCDAPTAKRWQAAWDGACIALGGDPKEYRG